MTPLAWTSVGLVIEGDDLHAATVRGGPWGGRVEAGPMLGRFLSMPADEARAALRPLRAVKRVSLVVPGAWCAARPLAMTSAMWPKARVEVQRSVDRLLPMPADDVELGMLDVFGSDDGPGPGGALVGVRRSRLEPWLRAIEAALGRRPTAVLSPAMAALGLGLLDADICEPGAGPVHRLRAGRLRAAGEAAASEESGSARVMLPGAGEAGSISPIELAAAGALAPIAGAGVFHPLGAHGMTPTSPWVAPAGAVAAAVALLAASSFVHSGRLTSAARELAARQSALEPDVEAARALRGDAERLIRLIDNGVNGATRDWRSVMPAAIAAHRAMGEQGFVYRLDLTGSGLTLSGESPSASAVLERVEAGGELRSARHAAPVSKSSATGMDVFEIRAERSPAQGGAR